MAHPRPHWSLYAAIAVFSGYFLLLLVHWLYPPGGHGFVMVFRPGGAYVSRVTAGGAGERAGVRAGDRIVSIDGYRFTDFLDFRARSQHARAGDAHTWRFARPDGTLYDATFTTPPRALSVTRDDWSVLLMAVPMVVTFAMAIVTALQRPRDPTALFGALFLASISMIMSPTGPRGLSAAWSDLPRPIGWLFSVPNVLSMFNATLFFLFAARFPRPPRRWWLPWLAALPSLFVLLPISRLILTTVFDPERVFAGMTLPLTLRLLGPLVIMVYLTAGCIVLGLRYRRLTDANERRRVLVLLAGSAIATIGVLMIALDTVGRATATPIAMTRPTYMAAILMFMALPFSFNYAIIQHRLLDVRIIVRQGLQYAVARGVVLSIVPLAGAALVADLLLHGDEPFARIVRARGWIYAAVMGVAAIAHAKRTAWLSALDRRFFRDRYEAVNILRAVVADVRSRASVDAAAGPVVARIEQALHPHFVALLTSTEPREPLTTLAVSPASAPRVSLPAGGTVRRLASVLEKPLPVGGSDSGWLRAQLSEGEAASLASTGIELLVPVAARRGEIVLALGAKRSEEPYTAEDLELLGAIAEGLALLGADGPSAISSAPGSSECPQCGACFDSGLAQCPRDGAALTATSLPRALGGRYVLQRRLGRGGMGTVYEALDSALKRQVAVKVVRDDLLASADAVVRFEQEALAAAAFAHPHVVTVHDYGTAGGRAYLVMERLDGVTLRDALANGRLDPGQAAIVIEGMCSAIDAAHARRMVHRDLKPENIFLVSGRARVKVLDFGIAKFLPDVMTASATTGPGMIVGTMQYMAPEQLSGGQPSPSWDLWALGVITYEMVTGVHPFAGVPPLEWGAALLAGRFKPPSSVVPGLPASWDTFFARALHPDPEDRIASARAFAAEALGSGL